MGASRLDPHRGPPLAQELEAKTAGEAREGRRCGLPQPNAEGMELVDHEVVPLNDHGPSLAALTQQPGEGTLPDSSGTRHFLGIFHSP